MRRRLVILAIGLVAARAITTAGVIIFPLDCAPLIIIPT
jgi:hypothetical protein